MSDREEAIERLAEVQLDGGWYADSFANLSAVCKAVYDPPFGWTLGACATLRDKLVDLLGAAETPESAESGASGGGDPDDSRDRLEADIRRESTVILRGNDMYLKAPAKSVWGWLDRQAAITRRETLLENPLHNNPYVGLVRGKQWERKESSDYYCGRCGWKVTDHDSYCPECGGAFHRATNQPTSQSDAPKPAENAENDATKSDIRDFDDSREKLEADALAYLERHVYVSIGDVKGWLDRQRDITHAEVNHDAGIAAHEAGKILRERIDELEDERDELGRANKRLAAERDELKRQLDTMRDVTREFRDERDELKAELRERDEQRAACKAERDSLIAKLREIVGDACSS